MHEILLWVAAFISVVTFYVHTFIGGPRVAGPLLKNADLPIASKWLNYYCWHIVTLYLFLMGGAYAYVAWCPDRPELVVFLTLQNTLLSILSILVAIKGKINPLRFPSTTLFALVSLCGFGWLIVR